MTVRIRGDKFQADFMYSGVRYRREFATSAAASAWELDCRSRLLRGLPIEDRGQQRTGPAAQTLKGLVEEATRRHWASKKAADTMVRNAELFMAYVGPSVAIADALTKTNIHAYEDSLKARGRSDATVNRHLSAISVLCKVAVDNGWMAERPKGVTWHRKESQGRIRFLDEREETALLRTVRDWGHEDEAEFYEFLIDTGARLSEALDLQWSDVRDDRVVVFHETKNGETRSVPLATRSRQIMARRRADPIYGSDPGPWSQIDARANGRLWEKLQGKLPFLVGCVPHHIFRHTRCSRFAIAGKDLLRMKQWMGHKSITTTQRYAHLRPVHLEDMVS